MKTILRVTIGFIVVAFLTLMVLMYLEKKEGLNTSPSVIWEDVKEAGKSVGDSISSFFEDTGLKDSAAKILEKGADAIKGDKDTP